MTAPLTRETWRAQIAQRLSALAADPQRALADAGVTTLYGFLLGSVTLPLAAAAAGGDPALITTAVTGLVGGIGANLISELVQRGYDDATRGAAIAQLADDPTMHPALQQLVADSGVFELVTSALAGHTDQLVQLRAELQMLADRFGSTGPFAGTTLTNNVNAGQTGGASVQDNIFNGPVEIVGGNKTEIQVNIGNVIIEVGKEDQLITAPKLLWPDMCVRAVKQASGAVGNAATVYVPRQALEGTFERFLQSDQIGFVLTGIYGSGKTSFLHALAAKATRRDNVCALFYDGERLRTAITLSQKTTLRGIIASDLAESPLANEGTVADFWRKLEKLSDINQRRVLILIDNIDWRGGDRNLLAQIDRELIGATACPWLKVVLVCMPENWERLKLHVPLTRGQYYIENRPSGPSYAADALTYSSHLAAFDQQELRRAYEQYRIANPAMPVNTQLKPGDWARLAHPRTLTRLAARGTQIIGSLWTYCRAFVDDCLKNGVLELEDLAFLERYLMPHMVRQNQIVRSISDQELYRMFNEQRRAGPGIDGRSDTPLTRLMDTGILERYGQPPRREVRFTTDEWLIYFAAEQFCQQAAEPTSTGAADVYIGLLRQARALPIIREITFVALALTIAVAKHDQITVLCQSADAALRALLREAAVAYGRDKPDEIRSVLLALLHTRAADQRDGILKRRSRVRSFVADVAQTLGMADIVRRAEHD